MKNLGVLLPKSTTHPHIGPDFFYGIKGAMSANGTDDIAIHTSNIGFGVDTDLMYSEAEKLYLEKDADAVIVFADHPKVDCLFPLAKNLGKLLIMANPDAKYPEQWDGEEYVLYMTLNEKISALLAGEYGIQNSKNGKGIFASNFYDGGYAFADCFSLGFTENGGTIEFNYMGSHKPNEFDTASLTNYLEENRISQTLYMCMSGPLKNILLDSVQPFTEQIDLLASASMWNELQQDEDHKKGILPSLSGYSSWYSDGGYTENQKHKEYAEKEINRQESPFLALGWDAGLLIGQLKLYTNQTGGVNWDELKTELLDKTLDSCRGEMVFHEKTHHFLTTQYLFELENDQLSVTEVPITKIVDRWNFLIQKRNSPPQTGWHNTYLCS